MCRGVGLRKKFTYRSHRKSINCQWKELTLSINHSTSTEARTIRLMEHGQQRDLTCDTIRNNIFGEAIFVTDEETIVPIMYRTNAL
jgi:hypothetical protein